jgi:adenosine deaminase
VAQGDAGLTIDALWRAPTALLHDHLDGGLRPATVIELADAIGWRLPAPLARHVLDRQVHVELAQSPASPGTRSDRSLRAGFSVGVNTDNRLMSGVMPSSELTAVTSAFDLWWIEVERLVTNAVEAGFAPYEERRRILDAVVRPRFAALRSA